MSRPSNSQMTSTQKKEPIYSVNHNREHIGRGSFGEVKIGRTTSGMQVAVKVTIGKDKIPAAKREIDCLMKFYNMENSHIVKLIDFDQQEDSTGKTPPILTFAMELAECSLDRLMRDGPNIRGLPQDVLTDLVMDCCTAMQSLRAKGVAHRDIKHLNILVFRCKQRSRKSTYSFKFCDLGNASESIDETGSPRGMNSLVGTPNVLHPKLSHELTKGKFHRWRVEQWYSADECDLWSLACTLYFASSGHYPFPHSSKHPEVYHNAVIECLEKHPTAIAAKTVQGSNPTKYTFLTEITSQRYPKWFRVAFSTLIRNLLHNPNLEIYKRLATALVTSKEYTFLSLKQLDVVKYADMKDEELLREGHPSPWEVLELPQGAKCCLFGDDDEIFNLSTDLSKLNPKASYLVLPLMNEIRVSAKAWKQHAQPERFENIHGKDDHLEVRASYIGEGFLALHDADKMFTLFDVGKTILRQFLKKFRIQVVSTKDSVAYPLRFAAYANCSCQAWLIQNVEEQKTALAGMSASEDATKELTKYSKDLDQLVQDLDLMLKWVEELHLDEREIPGIEAELIRYVFCDQINTDTYVEDVQKSTLYTKELVQQCFDRRTAMANEFCGKAGDKRTDIRTNMLQGLSKLVNMREKLNWMKENIEERTILIEKPFQEIKRRVERVNSARTITEKDLRRSVAFHNNPARAYSSTAELRELAKQLQQKIDKTKKLPK